MKGRGKASHCWNLEDCVELAMILFHFALHIVFIRNCFSVFASYSLLFFAVVLPGAAGPYKKMLEPIPKQQQQQQQQQQHTPTNHESTPSPGKCSGLQAHTTQQRHRPRQNRKTEGEGTLHEEGGLCVGCMMLNFVFGSQHLLFMIHVSTCLYVVALVGCCGSRIFWDLVFNFSQLRS